MKKITLLLSLISITLANSQSSWKKIESENPSFRSELAYRKSKLKNFDLYTLSIDNFKKEIKTRTVLLPLGNGILSEFKIQETSNFSTKIAKEYGYIKSFTLKGIDDKTATGKISIGTDGVFTTISSGKYGTIYIDPYTQNKKTYTVYNRKDITQTHNKFKCNTEKSTQKKVVRNGFSRRTANDSKLRIFRLALACTGEYSQFHIANQGIPPNASDSQKKAAVLSAMNTTITRVNSIYERDLAVRLQIVLDANGQNKLIFLNPNTDNLSNNRDIALVEESQKVCDSLVGSNNYDIGHTFSTRTSGLAYIGVVCDDRQKAKGVTGILNPIGDPYDVDYVSHEIGHQFGAQHTFNNSCSGQRSTNHSVEPGSGSTIMGYAGICEPSIQQNSNSYFGSVSISNIWGYIQNKATCANITNTNNTPPTANAGADVSVPKSTPLILKAVASDTENSNSLTYCWEQIDNEIATMPPVSNNASGPLFRSLPPTTSPNRFLPKLETVISGNLATKWEVLPSVAREMNFSLLVRDNNPDGGANGRDDIKISVIDTEPFTVTSQNTATSWDIGSLQTITWNTSTTNQTPINCKNVRIKLSIDGGVTFPIILNEKTPNDGQQTITVPNNPTNNARILIEAVNNIFYNVNTTNFTIDATGPTFLANNNTAEQSICNNSNKSVSYNLNLQFINGFDKTVTLSASNLPNGVSTTFTPSTLNSNGTVTMTVSNLNGIEAKKYTIKITGAASGLKRNTIANLTVKESKLADVIPKSPADSAKEISILPTLSWSAIANTTAYKLEVATDADFNNIILNTNLTENSYKITNALKGTSTYFWRVKPINDCGEGNYSTVFNFTTEVPSYCTSTFTNSKNSEFITNVTFNTINNTSGDDHTNSNEDGFQDFTFISTAVIPNKTYEIKVSFDVKGFQDHCYVFIDWNQNFVFEQNERYDLGILYKPPSTPSAPGPLTKQITVPSDAVLGKTRMRVVIEYTDNDNPYGNGACNTDHKSESGETEDYTIYVSKDGIPNTKEEDFLVFPNPSTGKVFVKFKTNTNNNVTINLFNTRGRLVESKKLKTSSDMFFKEISFNKISTGLYLLEITDGINTKKSKIFFR